VVPQVLAWVTEHFAWGSGALSGTATHNPGVAVRLQALHESVHAFSQHTPWAQNPDWHCVPALQVAPIGSRPQEEFVQKFPATHCESLVQALKQAFPLHTNGLHGRESEATHWPEELHVGGGA